MRLSPEYHRLSQIAWDDIFTLRLRGNVGLNTPFAKREREEIAICLASVIRSISKDRDKKIIWVYSNDFHSKSLLLNNPYAQVQILYKGNSEREIAPELFEYKLKDFLKELYIRKRVSGQSVDLHWNPTPTQDEIRYFFQIKEDSPYKHYIYSKHAIRNINKLLDN